MILKKKQRSPGFTMVDNGVVLRPDLSAKAKGILLYLMSRPENWNVSTADIVAHMKDGTDGVRAGINELRALGYMKLDPVQSEDGKLQGSCWYVADTPEYLPGSEEYREPEKPTVGKSNPINNIINTNKGSKKEGAPATLFGDDEKALPFESTPLAEFDYFEKKMTAPGLEHVDLRFYHGCVMDWSIKRTESKKAVKRTVKGWLATARNFMRRDIQDKKLKVLSADTDQQKVDAALQFLNL